MGTLKNTGSIPIRRNHDGKVLNEPNFRARLGRRFPSIRRLRLFGIRPEKRIGEHIAMVKDSVKPDYASFVSFTDPFSPSLAYFFKQVMKTDPLQARYFSEINNFPELAEYLEGEFDGQYLTKLKVTNNSSYETARKQLVTKGIAIPK